MTPTELVRDALDGTGLNLVGSCPVSLYDQRAPAAFRSVALMPRARGLIVVASAGRTLWDGLERELAKLGAPAPRAAPRALPHSLRSERELRSLVDAREARLAESQNPIDDYVDLLLERADLALARARVGSRRFEARLDTALPIDFRALGELVGLGSTGPFGLLIHPEHGPWWALRAAWLVDAPVPEALVPSRPCAACSAPCVGPRSPSLGEKALALANAETRSRCVLGQGSRYSDAQIAYHEQVYTSLLVP